MEGKVVKKRFLKKLGYSISKFEQYPEMATEGLKSAIKYLVILTAIVTIFVTIGSLLQAKKLVQEFSKYVQENIPEFSYSNGNLSMEMQDTIIIEEIKDVGIDKIVINTLTETTEQKDQIEKDNLVNGITMLLFKDEIVLEAKNEESKVVRQTYTYSDLINNYVKGNVETFNKAQFIEYIQSDKMSTFYISYGVSAFVYLIIANIIMALLDTLEVAILGLITTTIARVRMRFAAIYNMAVYSMTLPMLLNIGYIVVNYFTDFKISYFQVAYITIAYICLSAAIFILKDDFIKKMQEVEKIKQEQTKVNEEIQEKKEYE